MSELNVNGTQMPEVDPEIAAIQKMFASYNTKSTSDGKLPKDYILKKMFSARNPQEKFRLLPYSNNPAAEPFEIAYFHDINITVNGGGKRKYTKIYCPRKNDPKVPKLDASGNPLTDQNGMVIMVEPACPLCDKQNELLKKQSGKFFKKDQVLTPEETEIKERDAKFYKESNQYAPKQFKIIKGIDRNKEMEGPKFWRFKVDDYKKQGVADKLMPAYQNFTNTHYKPFGSVESGCDVSITVIDSKTPTGIPYKSVSAIFPSVPSKLHSDPYIVNEWLEDKTTWRDVFKPKSAPNITPHEFMELVAIGAEPYWDDTTNPNSKHWVFPGRPDLEEKANARNSNFKREEDDEEEMTHSNMTAGTSFESKVVVSDVFSGVVEQPKVEQVTQQVLTTSTDMDDLPF